MSRGDSAVLHHLPGSTMSKHCFLLAGIMLFACLPVTSSHADLAEAEAFYNARKWPESIAAYREALPSLKGEQAADALLRIAKSYRYDSKYDQGIESYDRVLAHPDITPALEGAALTGKGYCLYLNRKYDEALQQFSQAVELAGSSPATKSDALMYSGYIYNKIEKPEKAIECFQQAANLEGNNPVSSGRAQLVVGDVYRNLGEYDKARDAYVSAARFAPDNRKMNGRIATRLEELEALLLKDAPFYMRPYVSKVRDDKALISWVAKGNLPSPAVTFEPSSTSIAVEHEALEIAEGGFVLNRARVSGLTPGTKYEYRIQVGDEAGRGSFIAQLPAGADRAIEFVVIGDTQTNSPIHSAVAKNVAKHKPEFVVHCGDCVESGSRWLEWQSQLIGPAEPYLPTTILWPTRGNHDGGPYYPRLFDLGNTQHYSFDYGNVHFAVLDSFGPNSSKAGRQKQAEWLKQDLAESEATWKFIATHDPMMTSVSTLHWWGEEELLPVIQTGGVDFVMSGHHHSYRRFLPLKFGDHKPVFHVTTGGAGGGVGGGYKSPLAVMNKTVHHHTHFKIEGNRLEMTAIDIDGNQLDHLVVIKQGDSYQPELMEQAVEYAIARPISQLMYNMLKPRTDDVIPVKFLATPEAGKPVKFEIDISQLASGGVKAEDFPPGTMFAIKQAEQSDWNVAEQAAAVSDGKLVYEVVAPEKFGAKGSVFNPPLVVLATGRLDERTFEWQLVRITPK